VYIQLRETNGLDQKDEEVPDSTCQGNGEYPRRHLMVFRDYAYYTRSSHSGIERDFSHTDWDIELSCLTSRNVPGTQVAKKTTMPRFTRDHVHFGSSRAER
jgi:hypothetical protein